MKGWWEELAETWEARAAQYEREAVAAIGAHSSQIARTNALRWRDAAAELRAAGDEHGVVGLGGAA